MRLFDPADPDADWPAIPSAERAYLTMMADVRGHVANVATRWRAVRTGDRVLPLTVNDGARGDSYVCTPRAAYVDYARAELDIVGVRGATMLRGMLHGVDAMLRSARIDRIVGIDNWLLSTNLHGDWDGADLAAIRTRLAAAFPDHVLSIRSVDDWSRPALAAAARRDDWVMLPSRQVWVVDDLRHAWRTRNQYGNDRRLVARSGLSIGAAVPSDAPRIADLYRRLYVGKYSALNPVFTPAFVAATMASGLIAYRVARDGARVMAVAGLMARGGIATPPVVGYDTDRPQAEGLYRIASWMFMEAAMTRGLRLHGSAGAAHFKRLRGARGVIEYWAMHVGHLSRPRAAAIRAFAALLTRVAVPMMRRNGW
ncbi:GNAT family N-acetyltransferase [Sphingomonas sp. Leaf412]|uniref:GNAT family N-acetyltransferase n=1 Tax=Sphingomonas sp. Leaf412 TaxID=1736370 RepID=UPI0006FC8C6D|nr:GNAT family N-acetyltransferase [Sphingomonas sp. Leaf412]